MYSIYSTQTHPPTLLWKIRILEILQFSAVVVTPGMHLSTDCACSCSNRHWSEWRVGWGPAGFFSKVTPQQRKVEIFNHYWILWMTLPGVVGQEPPSFLLGNTVIPTKIITWPRESSQKCPEISFCSQLSFNQLGWPLHTLAWWIGDSKKRWWDLHSQNVSEAIFRRCAWGRWSDPFSLRVKTTAFFPILFQKWIQLDWVGLLGKVSSTLTIFCLFGVG